MHFQEIIFTSDDLKNNNAEMWKCRAKNKEWYHNGFLIFWLGVLSFRFSSCVLHRARFAGLDEKFLHKSLVKVK